MWGNVEPGCWQLLGFIRIALLYYIFLLYDIFILRHCCYQLCYKCMIRPQIHSGLNIVEKAGYKNYRQTTINPKPNPAKNTFLN